MVCPYCKQKTQVTNSRGAKSDSIWRRRRCTGCQAMFSTREDYIYETVIKIQSETSLRDLTRSEVSIDISKALQNTNYTYQAIDQLTKNALTTIMKLGKASITEANYKMHIFNTLRGHNVNAALRYELDNDLKSPSNRQ